MSVPWRVFPGSSAVERWNAGAEGDTGSTLGQEDLLEKEMATHSGILAWRIPGGRKELDMTEATEHTCMYPDDPWGCLP